IVLDPHFEMDFSDLAPYMEENMMNFENKFKCLQVGHHVGVKFEDLDSQDLKNLLDAASPLTDAMNNVVDILFKRRNSLYSFYATMQMLTDAQEEGSLDRIETRIRDAKSQEEEEAWKRRRELYLS